MGDYETRWLSKLQFKNEKNTDKVINCYKALGLVYIM